MLILMMLSLTSCLPQDANNLGDMYVNNLYPNKTDTYNNGSLTYEWNVGYFKQIYLNGTLLTPGGGSGITSVDTGTPSNITGILTGNGSVLGSLSIPLTATNGGTGLSTYNTGDMLYSNATNTLTQLSGNTTSTNEFLRSTGSGGLATAPSWQAVSKADVGLSSVENTALSTWAGSINITTLGTVTTGTLQSITLQGTISSGSGLTFGNFTAGTITGTLSGSSSSCSGNAATVTGLSVTAGKTLTVSNSMTLAATDGATLTIGTGGTLGTAAYTASTAYLASGGTAAAVTGLSVTAGKTLTVSNSMTLAATDGATLTIGSGGTLGTAAYTASSAYSPIAGSGSITTVGTISSGTWQGGLVIGTYGGTGVNNSTRTITIGGNVTFSGAYTFTGTLSNTTAITFPTSGTLMTLGGGVMTGNIVQSTNDYPKITVTTVNGTGATTLTAAALTGGLIIRTSMTAARSDPTDTATAIIGAISGAVVGTSFRFTVENQTATYTETISAGSGVTLSPSTITIPTLNVRNFLAVITNVGTPAVTIYDLGASSAY